MASFQSGVVVEILSQRTGLQRVMVRLDERALPERAYVLDRLIGPVALNDRVVVNVTAVELGLGTGGWHVVHWNLDRPSWGSTGEKRGMKLRYTSLQTDVEMAEEDPTFQHGHSLDAMPVVTCLLHSQLACVAAAFKHVAPDKRLGYVMSDSASLPIALSDLVASLNDAGLVDVTVTAGQAFGGDREAVNVASAIHVARQLEGCDAVVVCGGPGVVGTNSRLGFSALEVAGVLDFVSSEKGLPIVALRVSDVDERERHRGISHHATSILEYVHHSVVVPVPSPVDQDVRIEQRHQLVGVDVPNINELLLAHNITLKTMGRTLTEDPRFGQFSGAAGLYAGLALLGRI